MIHKKTMVVKESEGFRLSIKKHEVLSPKGLYSLDFLQESLDENGRVVYDSTYNFHLTEDEIEMVIKGLLQ